MTTRMVHPQHGATTAYNTNDIDYLKKLGWAVQTPEELAALIAAKTAKPEPDDHEHSEPEVVKAKPGRKAKK